MVSFNSIIKLCNSKTCYSGENDLCLLCQRKVTTNGEKTSGRIFGIT